MSKLKAASLRDRVRWLVLPLAAVLMMGCGVFDDDDDDDPVVPPAPQTAKLRVVHASPDAPPVNVVAGANNTALVSNFDYQGITPLSTLPVGSLTVTVNGILPGSTPAVLGPANLNLEANKIYTAIAADNVAELALELVAIDDTPVASGQTRVTVYHGAPAAPQVDVYVTAPGADLATATALGSFAFKQSLGPVAVANGDYRIRVTPAGTKATVVFDSGPVTLGGGDRFLVATENVLNTELGAAYSPINLAVSDGINPSVVLRDVNTPAALRVVHASPDAPAVDIVVNDDFATPLINALSYPDFTAYVTVPADSYNVKVAADADNDIVAIDADLDLTAGSVSSVLAVGELGDASIAPLVLSDSIRRIATEARVRLVHGSPSAGAVDIYVVAPGTDLATATPAFSNVPFLADTGYVSLLAGDYDIVITATGSKTAAIGPLAVSVEAGGIYTAIARDEVGGGGPLGVILLDDFAVL